LKKYLNGFLLCPQNSAPSIIAYAKNGDKQFWKEKLHAAKMERVSNALMNTIFGFFFVFIMFSKGSQIPKVFPNAFPKMFPIAPGYYLSPMVCPKFNSAVKHI
jgi:hypothetical protein